jgi:CRISPR-associated protein Csd2
VSPDDDEELEEDADAGDGADVDLVPKAGGDSAEEIARYVPKKLRDLYEVHSYRHASTILSSNHAAEFAEVTKALLAFRITTADIIKGGGNESGIVKRVSELLRDDQWHETRISADMTVKSVRRDDQAGNESPHHQFR